MPNTSSTVVTSMAAAFAAGSLLTYFFTRRKSSPPAFFPATDTPFNNTPTTKSSSSSSLCFSTPPPTASYPTYDYENKPRESFLKVCDLLTQELLHLISTKHQLPPRETAWLEKVMNYTLRGGKLNRGLMVVQAGVIIRNNKVDNTTLSQLAVLGWAIEWLQGWLLIADDIMDSSLTRRGQPCWYKTLQDNWYIAINDAFTMEAMVYQIIKTHFRHDTELLLQLWDLLQETTLQTELGQLSDTLCDILQLPDLTPSRWELIVTYKTAYYSFYLSVALAMLQAGIRDAQAFQAAREILLEMGVYFQAQDDYLDCFATPEVLGKIGTDIADKKCGWLFTKAYHQLASPEQRAVLDQHYGACQVGSVEEQNIKDLYEELGLPTLYAQYEQESYDKIQQYKNSPAGEMLRKAGVPWEVFETFLQKVYKRSK